MNRDDETPCTAIELEWQNRGACRGEDPDIFFPLPGQPDDEARVVCARCPVRQVCRDYAMATDQQFGIWGGMTRPERVRMKGARTVRRCLRCDTPFMPKHGKQIYCSASCRRWVDSRKRSRTGIQVAS